MAGRTFEEIKQSLANDVLAVQTPIQLAVLMNWSVVLHVAARVCMEAGIFKTLSNTSSALSAAELVRSISQSNDDNGTNGEGVSDGTGASKDTQLAREEFITRILRCVVNLKLVDEVDSPHSHTGTNGSSEAAVYYLANEMTHMLATEAMEAGFRLTYHNMLGPKSTISEFVDWSAGRTDKEGASFTAPLAPTDGPMHRAFDITGTPTFDHWTHTAPHVMGDLSIFMKWLQAGRMNWWQWLPAEVVFGGSEKNGDANRTTTGAGERPFIVDVGGNLGYDLNSFAAQYPDHKLRLVLQDQPKIITEAKKQQLNPCIELQDYDFFTPQPVKGAKIYHLHKVLHDWPDKQSAEILSHVCDAMAPDSRIFIHDICLPDRGAPAMLGVNDVGMMMLFSARERSEAMWKNLVESVDGLEIRKIWQAPEWKGDAVVEVIKRT